MWSSVLEVLRKASILGLVFVFTVSMADSTLLLARHDNEIEWDDERDKDIEWDDIGTSAAIGAAIGGLLEGRSGAIIGGLAGGAGRFLFDRYRDDIGELFDDDDDFDRDDFERDDLDDDDFDEDDFEDGG